MRNAAKQDGHVSASEAARILSVSTATIRNWCRAGHLAPTALHPLRFTRENIVRLHERIRTNRFSRLRKRANRTASDSLRHPDGGDNVLSGELARFRSLVDETGSGSGRIVFSAALHLLQAENEAEPIPNGRDGAFAFSSIRWRREAVRCVMDEWLRRDGEDVCHMPEEAADIFLTWRRHGDCLGILYQGLSSVGESARAGAYFTPDGMIDAALEEVGPTPNQFLDPCCGTGRYLLQAAAFFGLELSGLHGFDNDPVAVDIARINLLLHYREADEIPDVHCLDSLDELANGCVGCATNHFLEAIDAIATNPPWGGCKNQKRHRNRTALIKSGESFSLFLEKSLSLLRPGGRLSFLLPEAMLRIKAHTDIRRHILTVASIEKISLLGRVFNGVFTPIIRLSLIKRPAPPDWQVAVETDQTVHHTPQRGFVENANHAFDVVATPADTALLERLYSIPHVTLEGRAEWALGIVTGDNAACLLNAPRPDAEGVLRGRDVFAFAARAPRSWICFCPERFQQVAPERLYRAEEKLVYRFVSDRLVFAYDDQGMLTLNSANIVIPRLPEISIKAALAFLNSMVFQYIFTTRFRTRKVLRGDLEMLPFPLIDAETCRRLEAQVDRCRSGEYCHAETLDRMVYGIFGLNESDIAKVEERLVREG